MTKTKKELVHWLSNIKDDSGMCISFNPKVPYKVAYNRLMKKSKGELVHIIANYSDEGFEFINSL